MSPPKAFMPLYTPPDFFAFHFDRFEGEAEESTEESDVRGTEKEDDSVMLEVPVSTDLANTLKND